MLFLFFLANSQNPIIQTEKTVLGTLDVKDVYQYAQSYCPWIFIH